MNRTPYLLRHAKSDWGDEGLADFDRPLAPRGEKAAARMAKHLATLEPPKLVLCSPAQRTRQTLRLVGGAGVPTTTKVRFQDAIYNAPGSALLDLLQQVPAHASPLMLIGHNPGTQELAVMLAAKGDKLAALRAKFPTGALAVLSVEIPWDQLRAAAATLTDFVVPREL